MSHVTLSKKKKKKDTLEPIIWYWVLYKEFCRGRVQLSSNLAVHRKRQIRHTITQMIMALEEYLRTLSSRFNTCIYKALKSLTRMHQKKKSVTRLQFCLSLSCLQTFNSSSPNSMGEILLKYLLPLHLDHPGVGFQSFG